MTCSQHIHNFSKSCSWLVYYWFKACSQHLHKFSKSSSWLVYELFSSFLKLLHLLTKNSFEWYFLTTCSQFVQELVTFCLLKLLHWMYFPWTIQLEILQKNLSVELHWLNNFTCLTSLDLSYLIYFSTLGPTWEFQVCLKSFKLASWTTHLLLA